MWKISTVNAGHVDGTPFHVDARTRARTQTHARDHERRLSRLSPIFSSLNVASVITKLKFGEYCCQAVGHAKLSPTK